MATIGVFYDFLREIHLSGAVNGLESEFNEQCNELGIMILEENGNCFPTTGLLPKETKLSRKTSLKLKNIRVWVENQKKQPAKVKHFAAAA